LGESKEKSRKKFQKRLTAKDAKGREDFFGEEKDKSKKKEVAEEINRKGR